MTCNKLEKILNKYSGLITGPNDLTAGEKPSASFYLLADRLSYLMSSEPDACLSAVELYENKCDYRPCSHNGDIGGGRPQS